MSAPQGDGSHRMRGFLQPHPNGTAAVLHRVSGAKFDLWNEDPRLISHVTLPSCRYFHHKGWSPEVVPRQHLAPEMLNSNGKPGTSTKSTLGADAPQAGEECPYDMHTLFDAARRCYHYNYNSATGDQLLPLFEVRLTGWLRCQRLLE